MSLTEYLKKLLISLHINSKIVYYAVDNIAIIAFVAFKFILDSKVQSNAVAKQGGMRK